MIIRRRIPKAAVTAVLGVLASLPAGFAQQALYVAHGSVFALVRAARGGQALVMEKGKLVVANGTRFGFKPVDEYAPFFVSIRNLHVGGSSLTIVQTGSEINRTFEFKGDFESQFPLKNVFVVLELNSVDAGQSLFLWEVGALEPRRPKNVRLNLPMNVSLGEGKFQIHVYSDGRELFHSQQPWTYVEAKLDQMVARRIPGMPDGGPTPFVGPDPEYPPKLKRAKTSGEAVVGFTVSPRGRVLEPKIVRATDAAFGDSALAAARLWRFLPRLKDGKPVEAAVQIPFVFKP